MGKLRQKLKGLWERLKGGEGGEDRFVEVKRFFQLFFFSFSFLNPLRKGG